MDLQDGPRYREFRRELRAFLQGWPLRGEEASLPQARQAALFRQRGIDRGYVYRQFPVDYGGSGREADVRIDAIVHEEYTAAGAPGDIVGPGPSLLAATLLEAGSESLRQRFIPPTLLGEIQWCQGYSEPGAGSDLASLRSRAERDGEEWVIHGHKIWTSNAHRADYMFGLFRTQPGTRRHDGISYLIIDMRQPGISVEAIRELTGSSHFNEVRFEGARTPREWTVGEPGKGWRIANITLRHERAMLGDVGSLEELFRALVDVAHTRGRTGDADVRQRLAAVEGALQSHCWTVRRRISAIAGGRESSVALPTLMLKLSAVRVREQIVRLAEDLLGDSFLGSPDQSIYKETPRSDAEWVAASLRSLAYAIGGGTSNIQRNIIAERGLGLPREPAPGAPRGTRS